MKVMVVGAERFLGIQAITRLYRDNYRVVGVYQTNKPEFAASVPHSKYVSNDLRSLKDIFASEKPDVLLYADCKEVLTLEDSIAKVTEITALSELSVLHSTAKVIYFSNVDVYGSSIKDEAEETTPQSIDAKTHVLCEQAISSFRSKDRFFNVFLRLPSVCGEYETLDRTTVVFRMVEEALKEGRIQVGLHENHYLVAAGDVVEAVVRSLNESIDGVYNIVAALSITGEELANAIYDELQRRGFKFSQPTKVIIGRPIETQEQSRVGQKAAMELGLVLRKNLSSMVDTTIQWYQDPRLVRKEVVKPKQSSAGGLWRTLENLALFSVLAYITYWQTGYTETFITQYLTIYLIFIAIVFGINQGIFSAILVSGYYVINSLLDGYSLTATFSNVNVLLQMVQALVIAMSIGYVLERKNFTIREKELLIEDSNKEIEIMRQINSDLGQIKMEQETRILKYESGLGKLYASIKSLNSLSQQEIFWGTLTSIRDLTDEPNISLFMRQPGSNFMRRLLYVGEQPTKFPKSYNITENPVLFDIVKNNRFYTNQYLNPEMPSVILPIWVNNQVTVLVMIENMAFEKLTLYYMNVLHITKDLLDDAYRNAHIYETLMDQYTYEGSSDIMKAEHFQKSIAFAQKGFENSGIEYTLMQLVATEQDIIEVAAKARRYLRDTDEIGRLSHDIVGAILFSTAPTEATIVVERLRKAGIEARIIPRK
jgi:nucleoside-diphosphate-sugar epimerase